MSESQISGQLVGASSRVTRRPNVPWKELDGIGVILALDSGDYFELNEVGLDIWKMLDGNRNLADCASRIAETYGLAEDEARNDVETFVEDLRAQNLVTVAV